MKLYWIENDKMTQKNQDTIHLKYYTITTVLRNVRIAKTDTN